MEPSLYLTPITRLHQFFSIFKDPIKRDLKALDTIIDEAEAFYRDNLPFIILLRTQKTQGFPSMMMRLFVALLDAAVGAMKTLEKFNQDRQDKKKKKKMEEKESAARTFIKCASAAMWSVKLKELEGKRKGALELAYICKLVRHIFSKTANVEEKQSSAQSLLLIFNIISLPPINHVNYKDDTTEGRLFKEAREYVLKFLHLDLDATNSTLKVLKSYNLSEAELKRFHEQEIIKLRTADEKQRTQSLTKKSACQPKSTISESGKRSQPDDVGEVDSFFESEPKFKKKVKLQSNKTNPQGNKVNPHSNKANPQGNKVNPQSKANPQSNKANPQGNKVNPQTKSIEFIPGGMKQAIRLFSLPKDVKKNLLEEIKEELLPKEIFIFPLTLARHGTTLDTGDIGIAEECFEYPHDTAVVLIALILLHELCHLKKNKFQRAPNNWKTPEFIRDHQGGYESGHVFEVEAFGKIPDLRALAENEKAVDILQDLKSLDEKRWASLKQLIEGGDLEEYNNPKDKGERKNPRKGLDRYIICDLREPKERVFSNLSELEKSLRA